jgi:uncharacterized membrane-anchored protein
VNYNDRATNAASTLVRVPAITALFWVVKILTTGAGETTSDFLGHTFSPVLVAAAGVVILCASLVLQLRMHRYVAWTYWLAVSMVAIFGTMFADVAHAAGLAYLGSTIAFAVILAIVFILWYRSEGTLSIHSITTRRRELFYWATVIVTFALGTAAGDMTATTFGWGYFTSGVAFLIAIIVVGAAYYAAIAMLAPGHRHRSTAEVLTFWLAYVLTRPLGASFADWMSMPRERGGLDWGDGRVSIVLFVVIAAFVAYLATTRRDVQPTADRADAADSAAFVPT